MNKIIYSTYQLITMLTCTKCNTPFVSSTYKGPNPICKKCRYGVSRNQQCELCYCHYIPQRVVNKTYNRLRCTSCQGKYKKKCNCCDSEFISYYHLKNCDICESIKTSLYRYSVYGYKIDPAFVVDKQEVEVTYIVNQQTHNGYCSSSGAVMDSYFELKKIYPLLVQVESITSNGYIIEEKSLRYYQREPIAHSNFCNAKTTFEIKSARIIM